MKRAKPNFLIVLTIAFGLFLAVSGTSQMVQRDHVIKNAGAATLYQAEYKK